MAGWLDGGGGIGNKAQLRPAKAGAGAWPELGKNRKIIQAAFCVSISQKLDFVEFVFTSPVC